MSSVNEILARLNLNKRDLNNISISQLRTIFQDLTVKEISTLCAVSRRFNTLCKDESFWRRKVSDDYGIHKKYGDTWRQTAINMDKVNMINLNGAWINGRTYRKILDDALQNAADPLQHGASVVTELQTPYLLPYAGDFKEDMHELQFELENDDIQLQIFANRILGRDYTEDELNDIYYIKSREMNVIYATVRTYRGEQGMHLPGHTITNIIVGTCLPNYDFLLEMIDPILYVMQFSSFSDDKLALVNI